MADQHAADHRTRRPLPDRDRSQPTRFSAKDGVLQRLRLTSLHRDPQAMSFRKKSIPKARDLGRTR